MVSGSRSYGTSVAGSDLDIKSIVIPPLEAYIGIGHNFDQIEGPENLNNYVEYLNDQEKEIVKITKIDGSGYDLRKFISLAIQNNPNILELLYCRNEEVRFCSPVGKMLRDNRHIFLSQRAYPRYFGYAYQQIKRLESHRSWLLSPPLNAPIRNDFDLPPEVIIPQNQLDAANAAIRAKTDIWLPHLDNISDADTQLLMNHYYDTLSEIFSFTDSLYKCAARAIGYDENLIFMLEKERKYKSAKENYKSYLRWKETRNPARSILEAKCGFDSKHGSHAIRLTRMCYEILSKGEVNVWRGGIDAEELLDIRNGNLSYDQLKSTFDEVKVKCDGIIKDKKCAIPALPDSDAISELSMRMIRDFHKI